MCKEKVMSVKYCIQETILFSNLHKPILKSYVMKIWGLQSFEDSWHSQATPLNYVCMIICIYDLAKAVSKYHQNILKSDICLRFLIFYWFILIQLSRSSWFCLILRNKDATNKSYCQCWLLIIHPPSLSMGTCSVLSVLECSNITWGKSHA